MLPSAKKARPDPSQRPLYCDVTGLWPCAGPAGGWSADLVGRHECVKGARLRVHFGAPTPQGPDSHALRGCGPDELRALAARLLNHGVPALRQALPSVDQVVGWLQTRQEAHTTFVGQGHHVELLDLGAATNDLHTRVEQPEARLLGQRLTPTEFNARFSARPGSSEHARHKTLALFPSRWQQLPPRPTLTPAEARARSLVLVGVGQDYYELAGFGAAVALDFAPAATGPAEPELAVLGAEHDYREALALARRAPATDAAAHDFRRGWRLYRRRFHGAPEGVALQDLSPGYLKSLLQKLVRYGSAHPTDAALLRGTVLALGRSPGSLVPHLQAFVRGPTALCKRLAITLCEDTSAPPEVVQELLAYALLCTEVPEWKPAVALLRRWAGFAVDGLRAGRTWQYYTGGRLPPLPPPETEAETETETTWRRASRLLDQLGGLPFDLQLLRSLASTPTPRTRERCLPASAWPMPPWHCLDHHCCSTLPLLLPAKAGGGEWLPVSRENRARPLAHSLERLFARVTGTNGRVPGRALDPASPFVRAVRDAQIFVLASLTGRARHQRTRSAAGPEGWGQLRLPDAWLSALVGQHEFEAVPGYHVAVFLNPRDPYGLPPVVPVPAGRGARSPPPPTEEGEKAARDWFWAKLQAGVNVAPGVARALSSPAAGAEGLADVRRVSVQGGPGGWLGELEFRLDGGRSWAQVREARLRLPLGPETAARLEELWAESSPPELQEALVWLQATELRLPRVSRDGSCTDGSLLTPHSAAAARLLLETGGLLRGRLWTLSACAQKLEVVDALLLRWVRERLADSLARRAATTAATAEWSHFGEEQQQPAFKHQTEALAALLERPERNLLKMDAGSGKSRIALYLVQSLLAARPAPRYVLWSLPVSALDGVYQEVKRFTSRVQLYDKARRGLPPTVRCHEAPLPGYVALIPEDRLREHWPALLPVVHESVFICDEFHRASAVSTQRTCAALALAARARYLLLLSGTPVLNKSLFGLLKWLQLVCPFPVGPRNLLLAFACCVNNRFETGVNVVEQVVTLPDAGAPAERGVPLQELLRRAYAAVTPALVRETLALVRAEPRCPVYLIARDRTHQAELVALLAAAGLLVCPLSPQAPLTFTDSSVARGATPDYDVVVGYLRFAEGFTLTRCGATVSSVYLSNQATRSQQLARVNRLGQRRPAVREITVVSGVLELVLRNYETVRSFQDLLRCLGPVLTAQDLETPSPATVTAEESAP